MDDKLDIVFLTDINYLPYFTVALTSLLENNLNIVNHIFLVHDIDNLDNFSTILNFFKTTYKKNIELVKIDGSAFNNYTLTHQLTKATYFRLHFANLLPQEIDKILFLDSDIIVNASLRDLIDLDFTNPDDPSMEYFVYAVDHKFTPQEIARLHDLKFTGTKYFNAGVLLINLKKWRQDDATQKLISTLEMYNDKILWADQDIMNLVFDNQWGELDYSYNAYSVSRHMDHNQKIIHYIGASKPWHFRNRHPNKKLYWHYQKLTPFNRAFSEDLTFANIMKAFFVDPIIRLLKTTKWKLISLLKHSSGEA